MLPSQLTSVMSQWNFLRNCANGKKYEIFCRNVAYIVFGIFAWPRKNSVMIQLWTKMPAIGVDLIYTEVFSTLLINGSISLSLSKGPVKQMFFELWLKYNFMQFPSRSRYPEILNPHREFCQSCLLLYQGYQTEAHGLQLWPCVGVYVHKGRSNEEEIWEITHPLYVVLVVHNQHMKKKKEIALSQAVQK